jgi:hypothetical protein
MTPSYVRQDEVIRSVSIISKFFYLWDDDTSMAKYSPIGASTNQKQAHRDVNLIRSVLANTIILDF